MPTVLGQQYDIYWRGNYPQMLNEDDVIWERFLEKHHKEFLWFYYNVHVGGQLISDPTVPENVQKAWWKSTAKRIDVIGEKEKEIWIIEVAARPGFRALGQVMTYVHLWNKDPKINKPIKSVLIGNMLDDDLQEMLDIMGVINIEV